MKIFFDKCTDAVAAAAQNKTYGIFRSTENTPNYNVHTHDCCEILFCLSGGKNFLIDNKVYEVNDNDIFILNQFEAHKITLKNDCPVNRYVVQIHPEFLFLSSSTDTNLAQCFYMRENNISNRISLSDDDKEYILGIFKSIEQNYSFGDDIMKRTFITQLLVFLNEKFITFHGSYSSMQFKSEPLKNAILYINEHIADRLTLEEIAKNSYISVNQLCKLFKTHLGTTVLKYINAKRISEAKKLLKSGCNVSDTAFMCGFRDYSNFIRSFTASVGISPGKYARTE